MARPAKSPLAGLTGTGGMGSKGVPAYGVKMPTPMKVAKSKAPAKLSAPTTKSTLRSRLAGRKI